jgi:ABC-type dipeptide/oligopeptide/nickel transport system permease subunit
MSTEVRAAARTLPAAPVAPVHGRRQAPRRWLAHNALTVASGALLLGTVALALLAPWVAPHDPLEQHLADALSGPSARYPLGTDDLGRDVLSRVIYGARVSLGVGFSSVIIGLLVGTMLGLVSGYYGGWIDSVIMRTMDVLFAFPPILLAIAIMAVLGPDLINLIIAITAVSFPRFARNLRAPVLAMRAYDYVTAARVLGASDLRILTRHILPNIGPVLIIVGTISLGFAILSEGALSFLGLGTRPPTPTWGNMISTARTFMEFAPWTVIAPGAALMLVVLAVNFLGDGLRDLLDPRMRLR